MSLNDLFQAPVFLAELHEFPVVSNDLRIGQCHAQVVKPRSDRF
jgi:hypothetical protein